MTPELEQYLLTSDSKALKVLLRLLEVSEEGILHTTLDKIAAECDVTKVTVNKVFQRLYAEGLLVKLGNGVYRLVLIR